MSILTIKAQGLQMTSCLSRSMVPISRRRPVRSFVLVAALCGWESASAQPAAPQAPVQAADGGAASSQAHGPTDDQAIIRANLELVIANGAERYRAAAALRQCKPEDVLPAMIQALRTDTRLGDANSRGSLYTIILMGRMARDAADSSDARAVMLEDMQRHAILRGQISEILGNALDEARGEIVAVATPLLDHPMPDPTPMVRMLSRFGPDSSPALTRIERFLTDLKANDRLRCASAEAMVRIGGPAVLGRWLNRPLDVEGRRALMLGILQTTRKDGRADWGDANQRRQIRALSNEFRLDATRDVRLAAWQLMTAVATFDLTGGDVRAAAEARRDLVAFHRKSAADDPDPKLREAAAAMLLVIDKRWPDADQSH